MGKGKGAPEILGSRYLSLVQFLFEAKQRSLENCSEHWKTCPAEATGKYQFVVVRGIRRNR